MSHVIDDAEFLLFNQWKEAQKRKAGMKPEVTYRFFNEAHNPFEKAHYNMSAQHELMVNDLERAAELAKAADDRHALASIEKLKDERESRRW